MIPPLPLPVLLLLMLLLLLFVLVGVVEEELFALEKPLLIIIAAPVLAVVLMPALRRWVLLVVAIEGGRGLNMPSYSLLLLPLLLLVLALSKCWGITLLFTVVLLL